MSKNISQLESKTNLLNCHLVSDGEKEGTPFQNALNLDLGIIVICPNQGHEQFGSW